MMDLTIHTKGDLEVDEHHTIEDTAIALGECILKALGDKRGIERYGYCLPMDDCLCSVALDFGGRPWLVWDAEFYREKIAAEAENGAAEDEYCIRIVRTDGTECCRSKVIFR